MALNDIIDVVDRDRLEEVQTKRFTIIHNLTKDGIPTDKMDRQFLLETMRDADKSVYSKAKIKVADKTGEQNANAARIIADVLARHMTIQSQPRTVKPELGTDIKLTDIVEGETTIGQDNIDYDAFIGKP